MVGTGGHELRDTSRTEPRLDASTIGAGALRLELRDGGADYQFIDTASTSLDSGSLNCDGEADDQTMETAQTAMIANSGGVGVNCRVGPDPNAAIITIVPAGTVVELRGVPEAGWQPVRCGGRDGYIAAQFIAPGG